MQYGHKRLFHNMRDSFFHQFRYNVQRYAQSRAIKAIHFRVLMAGSFENLSKKLHFF